MRKTAIPLLLLLCVWTISLQAQQTTVVVENAGDEDDLHLKIGALAGLTLAMNTADYQVSRVSRFLGLGSHFGVRASIPLGRKTRIVGGLGYHTLSFRDENKRVSFNDNIENHSTDVVNNGTLTTTGTFQYTVVTAMLQFSQFFIGVNVGLPAASEMKNEGDNFTIPEGGIDPASDWAETPNLSVGRRIRPDITPEKDDISTLIELRAGGEFPIVKSAMGDLNFGISLGWTFNQILKDSRANLPNYADQFYLPNVLFHVSYMFNI
ncbi:MAG: hypothetical protein IH600_13270 [Bacteroidetes bacterium]|nr:hypothetical protein [Bacteroidota bacterium]